MGYYPNLESREDLFEELNVWSNTWKNKLIYPTKRIKSVVGRKKKKTAHAKILYEKTGVHGPETQIQYS